MDQLSYDALMDSGTDASGAQRNNARDSLLLGANLKLEGHGMPVQVQVRVRNLSPGGLMAEYAGRVQPGDGVEVEVRGIGWVKGKVAWVTDGRIGVAFDQSVDPLAARKPVSGGARR